MENVKQINTDAARKGLHIASRVLIYLLLVLSENIANTEKIKGKPLKIRNPISGKETPIQQNNHARLNFFRGKFSRGFLGAFVLMFPYIWMLLTSFKDDYEAMSLTLVLFPKHWIFSNYKEIWTVVPLLRGVGNTLIVEVSVIAVGTFVSSMAAFSFAKLKLPHKNFWLLFLMSGMMVPYAALMMPQFRAFMALNMFDTLWPLILPGLFGNISMMFFLIQYMRGISNAFFEAAKIDGAGYMRMFVSVMIPMVKTALAAQIIFWFIGIWNDYFAPAIYLKSYETMTLQPMMARINSDNSGGTNLPLIMAGAVLSSIPMFVIYITCQKYFIESLAISGVKG